MRREFDVCKSQILDIKKFLAGMETKYGITTDKFLTGTASAGTPMDGPDFKNWTDKYAALKRWEKRLSEYEEVFALMRF